MPETEEEEFVQCLKTHTKEQCQKLRTLCTKDKIEVPYSQEHFEKSEEIIKTIASKHNIPVEDLKIEEADYFAQKHAWIGVETYKDYCRVIEGLAKHIKQYSREKI